MLNVMGHGMCHLFKVALEGNHNGEMMATLMRVGKARRICDSKLINQDICHYVMKQPCELCAIISNDSKRVRGDLNLPQITAFTSIIFNSVINFGFPMSNFKGTLQSELFRVLGPLKKLSQTLVR